MVRLLVWFAALALVAPWSSTAFTIGPLPNNIATTRAARVTPLGETASNVADDRTQARIQALVNGNPILLFMKGSKVFPQCGFSNAAVRVLEACEADFHTVNVLDDDAIREGVKEFSQWPTIPQLYLAGEFVGGSDIMIELFQSGELQKMVDEAIAKQK